MGRFHRSDCARVNPAFSDRGGSTHTPPTDPHPPRAVAGNVVRGVPAGLSIPDRLSPKPPQNPGLRFYSTGERLAKDYEAPWDFRFSMAQNRGETPPPTPPNVRPPSSPPGQGGVRPAVSESEPFVREDLVRYSRHLLLPEVGLAGQKRLRSSKVLLVGAGG